MHFDAAAPSGPEDVGSLRAIREGFVGLVGLPGHADPPVLPCGENQQETRHHAESCEQLEKILTMDEIPSESARS